MNPMVESAPVAERSSNDLCTPIDVLVVVEELGRIALDPCANRWSKVGAGIALDGSSLETDGLLADWRQLARDGLVFVNPPYGRGAMPQWAEKVVQEARAGCEIIMLVKGDHSTRWWKVLREAAQAVCYWHERISFEGGVHGSGNFASTFVYFGPRPHLFAHVFAAHGDVRVLGTVSQAREGA